jgi:hypothetical protein
VPCEVREGLATLPDTGAMADCAKTLLNRPMAYRTRRDQRKVSREVAGNESIR